MGYSSIHTPLLPKFFCRSLPPRLNRSELDMAASFYRTGTITQSGLRSESRRWTSFPVDA